MTAPIATERQHEPECRAMVFGTKIFATYRTHPGATERWLKNPDGTKREFPSEREAILAARKRASEVCGPSTVHAAEIDAKRVSEALGVEAWLKVKRADAAAARKITKPGRRQVVVVRGRVG